MFENSYKIRVSSRAIIVEDGKILLAEFGGGQYYNFIGGGIEANETAKQAVIREVMEESGLTVDVGELVFTLEYEPVSCDFRYGKDHHISFFFRCHINKDVPPQVPSLTDINPDDPTITSAAKWVPIAELSNINVVPKIADSLIEYLKTGTFEPLFWATDEQERQL
jgi:ADP-ribose pyrophosphatase